MHKNEILFFVFQERSSCSRSFLLGGGCSAGGPGGSGLPLVSTTTSAPRTYYWGAGERRSYAALFLCCFTARSQFHTPHRAAIITWSMTESINDGGWMHSNLHSLFTSPNFKCKQAFDPPGILYSTLKEYLKVTHPLLFRPTGSAFVLWYPSCLKHFPRWLFSLL